MGDTVRIEVRGKREPVCSYCGHGLDLHDGDARDGRVAGWCRACVARREAGELEPMCWGFVEG